MLLPCLTTGVSSFQAKLSIMLITLVAAVVSYIWMEHKIRQLIRHRLPKIPKPRHKVRGYRYLEDENSDETGSEREEDREHGDSSGEEAEGELPKGRQTWAQRRKKCNYEQTWEEEEEAGDKVG